MTIARVQSRVTLPVASRANNSEEQVDRDCLRRAFSIRIRRSGEEMPSGCPLLADPSGATLA